MPANTPIITKMLVTRIVLVIFILTSLSCRAGLKPDVPSVTPTSTPSIFKTALPTPGKTATATAPAHATLPPPGTKINVAGEVQEVHLEKDVNWIIVDGVKYQVPAEILVIILQHLHIGAPIVFIAEVNVSGVLIIINVIKINNVVIIIHPKNHEGGDEDED